MQHIKLSNKPQIWYAIWKECAQVQQLYWADAHWNPLWFPPFFYYHTAKTLLCPNPNYNYQLWFCSIFSPFRGAYLSSDTIVKLHYIIVCCIICCQSIVSVIYTVSGRKPQSSGWQHFDVWKNKCRSSWWPQQPLIITCNAWCTCSCFSTCNINITVGSK